MAHLSIITPSYNYAHYLPRCLTSVDVLAGRSTSVEHVVVDDASGDDSVAVIADHLPQRRHRKFAQHDVNLGLSATLNTALEMASGTWVLWLNADDACDADGLLRALEVALEVSPRVGLLYGDVALIDANADPLGVLELYRGAAFCMRLGYNPLLVPSVLFRRSCLGEGFDTRYRLLMDLDAYLTVLRGHRARYVPFTMGEWRVHAAQQCAVSRPGDADEWRYLAEKHGCRFGVGPTRRGRNVQRVLKAAQLKYALPRSLRSYR